MSTLDFSALDITILITMASASIIESWSIIYLPLHCIA